jgi:hypothetical protein
MELMYTKRDSPPPFFEYYTVAQGFEIVMLQDLVHHPEYGLIYKKESNANSNTTNGEG